jgi:hypothetical protein
VVAELKAKFLPGAAPCATDLSGLRSSIMSVLHPVPAAPEPVQDCVGAEPVLITFAHAAS